MKKLILTLAIILIASVGYAYIIPNRTRATVDQELSGDILIHRATNEVIVTMQTGYLDGRGNLVSTEENTEIFQDISDDPSTSKDETDTSYTDFLSDIGFSWVDVDNAVKVKRGL